MIKRSEYRGNYGKNKSSNNRLIIILKIFTPFITIIAFGLISFIFIIYDKGSNSFVYANA